MNYAYIRVSAKDQNESRQVDAMRKEGIQDENMFIDKPVSYTHLTLPTIA